MKTIKTSVSMDGDLYCRAKELADELQVSWNSLVSLALKAFIERHETRKIMDPLNEVYAGGLTREDEEMLEAGRRMFRKTLDDEQW